ncbi:ATP-grasp domain-containing protein [Carboxylicivirga sp. N1Y90]|uniref:ATP-grasp domain-containing protein n=1 Tax=Carboxylicivirga fragile TaxID=3417571 RepID=UPI003D352E71|nr:ATP-grasp domain-containing protein [Marinilabiliaceae bacterium N1Y90]
MVDQIKEETSKKKIIILPAIFDHIEIVQVAQNMGYEVITCDNLPSNPAHSFGNIAKNVSLLDFDSLCSLAKEYNIDAVAAFSTDIGAISAAHIAKESKLINNPLEVVQTMANKGLFRTFLLQNNFKTPPFQVINSLNELELKELTFPAIIKPIDRAGSKGVCKVSNYTELEDQFEITKSFSFDKKVIVEEYIESGLHHIHGDGIVQNGKLIFLCLGDQFFGSGESKYAPIATSFPSTAPTGILNKIHQELQRFISTVGYENGGINTEIRIKGNNDVYFIEIAPRFGGNYIAKTIGLACNLNIIRYAFLIAIGEKINIPKYTVNDCIFQFSLRAENDGIFKTIKIKNQDKFKVLDSYTLKENGDLIKLGKGPENIISVFILEATNKKIKKDIIHNTLKYFEIYTEK